MLEEREASLVLGQHLIVGNLAFLVLVFIRQLQIRLPA